MGRPENGVYIIQGEVNLVVTAMRRSNRWASHSHQEEEQDPLINSFAQLKDILNTISDLSELAPNEFLGPFLEVIRSEDTTGPITGLALTSINKFLSYGLIDSGCETAAPAIENIADAVTHARFVGTDPSSDEVVLMKILHVLRTLLLTPAGAMLTNESVCEIMQSCFRICFEMRLSELLRKSAEHTLMDMVQLLFSRLPQFKEDAKWAISMKKLKMRTGSMDPARAGKHRRKSAKSKQGKVISTGPPISESNVESTEQQTENQLDPELDDVVSETVSQTVPDPGVEGEPDTAGGEGVMSPEEEIMRAGVIATTPVAGNTTVVDIQDSFKEADEEQLKARRAPDQTDPSDRTGGGQGLTETGPQVIPRLGATEVRVQIDEDTLDVPQQHIERAESDGDVTGDADRISTTSDLGDELESSAHSAAETSDGASVGEAEYVNPRGVRFMPHSQGKDGSGPLIPYGLPCVRELYRFLISLTNPLDRHNTDVMVHMGLSLLTVALESGADHVPAFNSLLHLVKDDLCKNLFFLLQSERLSLFAASIRVCFLLFESMRSHLKFQLEMYLMKLMDVIVNESPRISYEMREIALESVGHLLRVPGFVTELYLNYDCKLYCSNLFEDLMKLLSKNAFPVAGLFTTHLLSLDALLAVIDSIEQHCHHRVLYTAKKPGGYHGNLVTKDEKQEDNISTQQQELQEEAPDSVEEPDTPIPPPPPPSGYSVANKMSSIKDPDTANGKSGKQRSGPKIKPNRMKVASSIPTEEDLAATKRKKKIYQTATEQFSVKPGKGIAYLQEHGLIHTPQDIVTFMKENPQMCKKQIGEYISNKKNKKVLEAYQKSFDFETRRVDEALRMYLESFRLPGESPVISYLLEHFAEHWIATNTLKPAMYNADAVFTLAYAVIMLNVDQHNTNAKKQNIPMTIQEFRKNLKKVNGGQDFDQDMLDEIYHAIKTEEIVMPAEQTGLVKDLYLWKVLTRRGATNEGAFLHCPTGAFDKDLFAIVWGPSVAALSFVFDKSLDESIVQKAVSGFRKCAMISAHYGMSDVFDNLVISLCKFSTLLSTAESSENIPIQFGNNLKAQLAARTVFGLAHRHGDILREGWKNILDCMLQLYRAKLLPELLVKVEDFLDPTGRISLIREEATPQRSDSGVFSSFYSYFALTDAPTQRGPSQEEQEVIRRSHGCIQDCHLEQLITESKFLRVDSLQELIKALIFASRCPEADDDTMNGANCSDDASVFYLELLIKVVLQNRDRIGPFWQSIRDHIYNLVVNANENSFLVERAVVGLLRLAIRLLRREEIASQVLASLRIMLMMKPKVIHSVCRQVAFGLHDLLKTNAANIHSQSDWYTLFTLLEVSGAGTNPPPLMQVASGVNVTEAVSEAGEQGAQSDSEVSSTTMESVGDSRGYMSDSELEARAGKASSALSGATSPEEMDVKASAHGSWLLVYNRNADDPTKKGAPINQYSIVLNEELKSHDTKSLMKSCETLAFLVRDAAHVTPHNFESCVHTIRTFVEASIHGGIQLKSGGHRHPSPKQRKGGKKKEKGRMSQSRSSPSHLHHIGDSDEEREPTDGYHSLSIQLLDLMHTLHTRAATIFSSWAEEERNQADPPPAYMVGMETIDAGTSTLWLKCWCPLLQGIARLCCDSRRQVRSQALTYLQRALLVHDLQTLSAAEWENCFNKVLFPLLSKLLDTINSQDPTGIEETRMRASTLLCKVFLQHLTPLLSLSTFTALWLTILDFMDKYMHADKSDLLCEAIPESLKNMLLVMHTAGIIQSDNQECQLWRLTWDKIDTFLPNLRNEVFKPHQDPRRAAAAEAHHAAGQHHSTQQQSAQQQHQQPQNSLQQSPKQQQGPQQQGTQQAYQQQQASGQVPAAPTSSDRTGSPERRPESPLGGGQAPSPAQYILHPPLPTVPSPNKETVIPGVKEGLAGANTVPLLLNPDIMAGTSIPIISAQGPTDQKPGVVAEGP